MVFARPMQSGARLDASAWQFDGSTTVDISLIFFFSDGHALRGRMVMILREMPEYCQ